MKEVIKTIAIVILVGVSIFFAYKFGTVNERMTVLNSQDSLQSIQVESFDHALHDLELKFIGRGKHIQEFQNSVADLNRKLDETKQELATKIDDVNFSLEEFKSSTNAELTGLKTQLQETSDKLSSVRRETNNEILDLKQILRRLNRNLNNIEDQVESLEETKMDKPQEED